MSIDAFIAEHAIFAIPTMLVVAMLVDVTWRRGLLRLAARTASELDDDLLLLARGPVVGSLVLIGLGYALAHAGWAEPNHFIARAVLLSIATLLWTRGGVQASRVMLDYLTVHQERWHIVQPRTLPIFQLGARIVIIGGGIYFLFLSWNIDVSAWIASAGIAGIAIAYAAQDTLANLFAGFTILTDAPYKLDDYLVLENGLEGRVTHIGFRSTRILTLRNVEVVIPNATMAGSMITNMSGGSHQHARLDVSVGVGYGSDVDAVRALLLEVADELPGVLHHTDGPFVPDVHFLAMGASSLDFVLQVWLVDPSDQNIVRDAANTRLYKALTAAGIEIPFPKQDVYLHPAG